MRHPPWADENGARLTGRQGCVKFAVPMKISHYSHDYQTVRSSRGAFWAVRLQAASPPHTTDWLDMCDRASWCACPEKRSPSIILEIYFCLVHGYGVNPMDGLCAVNYRRSRSPDPGALQIFTLVGIYHNRPFAPQRGRWYLPLLYWTGTGWASMW